MVVRLYKDQLLLEKKENGTFALPYGENSALSPIKRKKTTGYILFTNIRGKDL